MALERPVCTEARHCPAGQFCDMDLGRTSGHCAACKDDACDGYDAGGCICWQPRRVPSGGFVLAPDESSGILLQPPLPLVGVSIAMGRERQQNDRPLANGDRLVQCTDRCELRGPGLKIAARCAPRRACLRRLAHCLVAKTVPLPCVFSLLSLPGQCLCLLFPALQPHYM